MTTSISFPPPRDLILFTRWKERCCVELPQPAVNVTNTNGLVEDQADTAYAEAVASLNVIRMVLESQTTDWMYAECSNTTEG